LLNIYLFFQTFGASFSTYTSAWLACSKLTETLPRTERLSSTKLVVVGGSGGGHKKKKYNTNGALLSLFFPLSPFGFIIIVVSPSTTFVFPFAFVIAVGLSYVQLFVPLEL